MSHELRVMAFLLSALITCGTGKGIAQDVRYRPSQDTSWHQSLNVFRLFVVRDGDTVGQVVRNFSIERRTWLPGSQLRSEAQRQLLNLERTLDTDTLTMSPSGRVLAINGLPADSNARKGYDQHPRLPEPTRRLRVGDTWTDSITTRSYASPGEIIYAAARNYRVTRLFDSLGSRFLEAVADGRLRYRDTYWVDSAAGRTMWFDVEGPMTARFTFDIGRGNVVRDGWSMRLTGSSGIDNETGGVDTIPAGLNSSLDEMPVSRERAQLLNRPLGAGDTLFTATALGRILMHVTSALGDTITTAMGRNDGLLGSVRSVLDSAGSPRSYLATWTDTAAAIVNHRVHTAGDSVIVAGHPGSSRLLPRTAWTVADFAMDELLVPLLLRMPADLEERELLIYRPSPNQWQEISVRQRKVQAGTVAVLTIPGQDDPLVMMYSNSGRLLAVGNSPVGSERMPVEGTPHRAELDALLQELQALRGR